METDQFYIEHARKVHGPFTFQNLQYFAKMNQITPQTLILVKGSNEWRRAGEIAGLFPNPQFTGQIQPLEINPPTTPPVINPVRSAPSVASPETSRKTPEKSITSPKHTTTKSFDWKKLLQQKPLVISAVLLLLCVVMGLVLVLGTSSKEEKEQTAQAPEISEETPDSIVSEPAEPKPAPVQPAAVPPKQDPHQKEIETFYKTGENFFSQKVYREAIYWYEKSEELPEAQYKLGICYSQGLGVSVNKEKAVKYFLKLAQENNAQAQYELGLCYLKGEGVEKNRPAGLDWLQKAADQGITQAVTAIQEEKAKIEEERLAELARQEAERQAEAARLEAERIQREAEKKAEEERIAAEKKAEEERQIAERKARNAARPAGERMVKTVDGIEYAFRWCPHGTFMMGSPKEEICRFFNEAQHSVTLTKGFWILETEVTQAMWLSVRGMISCYFDGANRPVECVSWENCQKFCQELSDEIGMKISLPTEAQWEYACRAGTTGPYAGNLDEMGWYSNNSNNETHPVGQKKPNAWGLYDMHGNVWEWCQDWYDDNYPIGAVTDPTGPNNGSRYVVRGGGWTDNHIGDCRSAIRLSLPQNYEGKHTGFRVIATDE